ncbi:MAG: carbohydrate ABC transporter permease [Caldilineaceae bacterium]
MRRQRTISKLLGFLFVGGGGLVMMLPFVWLISSSFKAASKIYVFPPQLIPDPFRWQNYVEVFSAVPVLLYTQNTLIVTVFATIGTVLSSIIAGYAFARLRFKGRDLMFSALLATLMLPYVVIMIPIYVMFSKIGWVNTLWPLIIPAYFGDAFFIFLLRQFFRTIPMELEDAARIDGASRPRVLFQIMAPLARPAIIVVTIQSVLDNWKAFMEPLIFLTKRNVWTLALGLNSLQRFETGRDWTHYMMVLGVFMVVPVVIMYFLAQREFIQGIVLTGMKA